MNKHTTIAAYPSDADPLADIAHELRKTVGRKMSQRNTINFLIHLYNNVKGKEYVMNWTPPDEGATYANSTHNH